MTLAYRRIKSGLGDLLIAASDAGICRISFPVELSGGWFPWFDRHFASIPKQMDHQYIQAAAAQLGEYLCGARREFETPLDLRGTDFQQSVWRRVLKIPYGATATYGELARDMGIPGGARAIGGANSRNPIPILVPCHRVVGTGGHLVGFGGGIEMKEALLELEGSRIPFSPQSGFSS